MRKLDKNAGMIGFLIMIMVVILIASSLIVTVAENSNTASEDANVAEIPGGPELIQLWPLLFIVLPIIYIAKKVR